MDNANRPDRAPAAPSSETATTTDDDKDDRNTTDRPDDRQDRAAGPPGIGAPPSSPSPTDTDDRSDDDAQAPTQENHPANEFSGLGPSGGPVDNTLSGDDSRNSHKGYGPDETTAGGIDDDVNTGLGAKARESHPANEFSGLGPSGGPIDQSLYSDENRNVHRGYGPDTAPLGDLNRDVDPNAVKPSTETSSYPFAGDLQTFTFGGNIDAPVIGDLTAGITVEFGEEFDIGLTIEHGTFVSPVAIDNDGGLAVAPDLSMGASAYFNEGFVPFETGIVDSKEIMGQYGLGGGVNFTHEEGTTSLNVYGGPGAGASVTYDRAYNFSARDGVRWASDQIEDLGRSIHNFFRYTRFTQLGGIFSGR